MALWFAKSRTIIHHLKRKVGFMGVFHQNIWTSSSSSSSSSSSYMQPGPLSSIFPFNSSQRFKSTEAASQHEHLYSTDDDGGDNSQEDITCPPFSEEKAEVPFLSGSDNLPARFSPDPCPSSLSDYHHQNITWSSSPL